jgi:hypothetical protein
MHTKYSGKRQQSLNIHSQLLIDCSKKREMTVHCSHWEISKLRGGQPVEAEPLSDEVFAKLKEIMRPILEDESWLAFRYPVDFSEYPEYYATVPYPMYLEIIHKRIHHKYYRHVNVSFRFNNGLHQLFL